MSGHTPGPYWHDDGMIRAPTNVAGVQSGKVLAVVRDVGDETEANIELFAAAPELLAVARYAVDNPVFDSAELDRMARAAIAKATGGQP